MKNLIVFLLLIVVTVTIYIAISDRVQLEEDVLSSIQFGSITHLPRPAPILSWVVQAMTWWRIVSGFVANGTEPFWAADFSGTTLLWQSPDMGSIVVSGFVGPISSWSALIWTESGSNTIISIMSWACNNGMSDIVFSGSIDLVFSGQTREGCISY